MSHYVAWGEVRGGCGHRHRTIEKACECARRDAEECRALGGGAYSDRFVERRGPDGEAEELTEADLGALADAEARLGI